MRLSHDGARRALKLLPIAGLLAAVLWVGYGIAYDLGAVGNVDRSEHLAGNAALLRQIPVYPGARYVGTEIGSEHDNGWAAAEGPVTGYTARRRYKLADPPERPVVTAWYMSRLAGRCTFASGSGDRAGRYFSAGFRCGNGWIRISPSDDWLVIEVDYDAYIE